MLSRKKGLFSLRLGQRDGKSRAGGRDEMWEEFEVDDGEYKKITGNSYIFPCFLHRKYIYNK